MQTWTLRTHYLDKSLPWPLGGQQAPSPAGAVNGSLREAGLRLAAFSEKKKQPRARTPNTSVGAGNRTGGNLR